MFKKLDKLIVKAFVGPFVATFFITLFVLVMQFFWLYIDDFVGKGLGIGVVFEFIWYQSAVLIPLALPLAILLSSLMTFGNLGESFELVAIRSAGISLLRFMRPLFFLTFFICCIAFLFSNFIIPVAYLKSRTLLADIVFAKPAFDLREGVFYDKINGFAIKIGKKEANDSIIRDVIIYEQGNPLQDNFIVAKSGIMRVTDNKRYLEFNLKDGWRYQERGNTMEKDNTEYLRTRFKEYTKQFDLSSFQFSRTSDSVNKNNERVYSMRQLNVVIDSLKKEVGGLKGRLVKGVYRTQRFVQFFDSAWTKDPVKIADTVTNLDEILPDSVRANVKEIALADLSSIRMAHENISAEIKRKGEILRNHRIEWQRKISLSLACLVLFLIGAPLGSIIRKGGLGTPLVFAILFFMLFYFSSNTGEKFAREGGLSAFEGMWMSIFVLVPIGIFLTYKAMRDSQLFNKEYYYRIIRFFASLFRK